MGYGFRLGDFASTPPSVAICLGAAPSRSDITTECLVLVLPEPGFSRQFAMSAMRRVILRSYQRLTGSLENGEPKSFGE
jgi:hypothetical protein